MKPTVANNYIGTTVIDMLQNKLQEPALCPPEVDTADLMENGKLLSDNEIKKLKNSEIIQIALKKNISHLEQEHFDIELPAAAVYITRSGKKSQILENKFPDFNSTYQRSIVCIFNRVKKDFNYYAFYAGKDALLGEGGDGRVKLAQDLDSGGWVAAKITLGSARALAEASNLRMVGKSSLFFKKECKVYSEGFSYWVNGVKRKMQASYSINTKGVALMPWIPGIDLEKLMNENIISWEKMKNIVVMMVRELQFVHNQRVLHRDIKPSNFMYDPGTGQVRLVDFAYAVRCNVDAGESVDTVLVGTRKYLPPRYRRYYGSDVEKVFSFDIKTEMYALAVTIRELINKSFSLEEQTYIKKNILQKMMYSESINELPSLKEVLYFFENIQPQKILVVDVSNYKQIMNMPGVLKSAHMVQLVDANGIHADEGERRIMFLALYKELREKGVNVSEKLLYNTNPTFLKPLYFRKLLGSNETNSKKLSANDLPFYGHVLQVTTPKNDDIHPVPAKKLG